MRMRRGLIERVLTSDLMSWRLNPDSAVEMDRSEVWLIEPNGRRERLEPDRWEARRKGSDSPARTVYQPLGMPAARVAEDEFAPEEDVDQHSRGDGRQAEA